MFKISCEKGCQTPESDLKILSDTLVNACTNTSAEYKGFHFNK